ncbi:retrovirus-related pol polyprotein from transposon TNT 1-94 [Tanacetum coccineum]|uniref:Retrovirus-related pol polyprotein from transposon TNT 1-94 n=1 Tax=Tanacetum coccineum TaxID=301880 RepID=A0ABQ5AQ87_9ASTR
MAQEKYTEGCSIQRPPLLEPNGFCFWKSRFEIYVKSKDINLWQVIQNNNLYYEVEDSKMKLMKVTPYELLEDDQRKKLGKNIDAKMTIYNALPRKDYEHVFMCKTAKEINDVWESKITKEKVKSLALKAKVTREQTSDDSDSQDGSDEDEETKLMAKNLRRLSRKGVKVHDKFDICKVKTKGGESSRRERGANKEVIPRVENIREIRNHPIDQVIGELDERTLRSHAQDRSNFFAFVSTIEPKNIKEAIKDESWTMAMQEELDQFVCNDVLGSCSLSGRSTCQSLCNEFSKLMHDEFKMSMMGELRFFLGLQIKQMNDGIFFNQSKYIGEMLKKFGLENSKVTKTPMSRKRVLTLDKDSESIDSTKYRGMIGSLLYLTASRPDIMFSNFLYARFYEDPKVSHLEAVKRIFRQTKGTQHLGLRYPKDIGANVLVYANSDHADDVADRKSISEICTYVGSCLTSWFSKKQASHTNSITESDYVAARRACQQALWMKQVFVDYNIMLNEVPILCDDKCVTNLTSSPIDYPRTNHIEIRHHFLKDNVAKKHIHR